MFNHQLVLQKLWHWIFPWTCIICEKISDAKQDLCQDCKKSLPWIKQTCWQCCSELYETFTTKFCGKCLQGNPAFFRTISLFNYDQPISSWITNLKFNRKLIYANLLGELLIEKLQISYQDDSWPELIIPIPLHSLRLQERGFNQALEIAKPIAKYFQIPIDKNSCYRTRATPAQSSLPGKDRLQNVKKAFAIKASIKANHIVIVDDVMTTGSTVNEFAHCLKKSGIERVDIWCCAKTNV